MTDENKAKSIKLIMDRNPTSATDTISLAIKADGEVLLRLGASLPDGTIVESHRTIMSTEVAKDLINNLCSGIEYYPTKPKPKKK